MHMAAEDKKWIQGEHRDQLNPLNEPSLQVSLQFEGDFGFECKETCDESYVELKTGDDWRPTGFRVCCQRPTDTFKSANNEMIVIYRVHSGASSNGFRARVWAGN